MSERKRPKPAELHAAVRAYANVWEHYSTYAAALQRILRQACSTAVGEVAIESRAQTVSSFAGKYVRKYKNYAGKDVFHEMIDLCGARVIDHFVENIFSGIVF